MKHFHGSLDAIESDYEEEELTKKNGSNPRKNITNDEFFERANEM